MKKFTIVISVIAILALVIALYFIFNEDPFRLWLVPFSILTLSISWIVEILGYKKVSFLVLLLSLIAIIAFAISLV